jgi:multisubunit Na+/H+ antiporter MnhG subunit
MKLNTTPTIYTKKRLYLYLYLITILLAVILACVGFATKVEGFNTSWDENFEAYETGLLTEETTKWVDFNGTSSFFTVSNVSSYEGYNSGYLDSVGGGFGFKLIKYYPVNDLSSGVYNYEINFKPTYSGSDIYFEFYTTDSHYAYFHTVYKDANSWYFNGGDKIVDCEDGSYLSSSNENLSDSVFVLKDTWNRFIISLDFTKHIFSLTGYDGTNYTETKCFWFNSTETAETLSYIRVGGNNARMYFDYFNTPSFGASVWGIDPESETEITDLDELLTIGYSGLEDYEDLYLTFTHPSGISSNSKEYDIDIIGGSGSIEVNLADFDIDKNGNWYLQAVASRQGYQVEDDLFLSGYGWIWSGNLTSGEYYLDINIDGFEDIFVMGDFNTWYDENSKFDEPTAMFSSIVGFFEPIFGTIGEFGNRIEDYFDKNTAYTKGAEIGKAIPLFGYYLEQINFFMGSFPLMNWLLVVILILVGIFIFKVIMKFIPFLGG